MNYNLYEFSKGPEKLKFHKTMYAIFSTLKYVNLAIIIIALIIAFSINNTGYFIAVLFLLSYILSWYVAKLFYNYYDYSFVEGSIRVIKVEHNKTRRLVVNFDAKNIISYGKVFGETFEKYNKNKTVKKYYACVDNATDNDLCIAFSNNGVDNLLIMPYDEGFLSVLIRYTGNRKLDKDFLESLKTNE